MKKTPQGYNSTLKPGKGPARGKPVRKRNPKRRASEFARCYGSEERVEWVKTLPCIIQRCIVRPSENAHTKTGGTSRKADAKYIVPLCSVHHEELHRGVRSFQAKYGINLEVLAALTDAAWRQYARWEA